MSGLPILRAFQAEIEKEVPGFKLAFKDESWSQKLLGKVIGVFNPGYLTTFTTTLGKTAYFPSKAFYEKDPAKSFATLAHEFVHLKDSQKHGVWFQLSYLMPQLLFLPTLLVALLGCFWSAWFLLLVAPALACLAPLPARWRANWEARGYAMNLAVTYWTWGSFAVGQKEEIAKNFYGPNYYRMVGKKETALDLLSDKEGLILRGDLEKEEPYSTVLAFMKKQGLARPKSV